MKKYLFLIMLLGAVRNVTAQNVGIGTAEPMNKLQVAGKKERLFSNNKLIR